MKLLLLNAKGLGHSQRFVPQLHNFVHDRQRIHIFVMFGRYIIDIFGMHTFPKIIFRIFLRHQHFGEEFNRHIIKVLALEHFLFLGERFATLDKDWPLAFYISTRLFTKKLSRSISMGLNTPKSDFWCWLNGSEIKANLLWCKKVPSITCMVHVNFKRRYKKYTSLLPSLLFTTHGRCTTWSIPMGSEELTNVESE